MVPTDLSSASENELLAIAAQRTYLVAESVTGIRNELRLVLSQCYGIADDIDGLTIDDNDGESDSLFPYSN